MSDNTLIIDMDRRCRRCKRRGATNSGLCVNCVTDEVLKRIASERKEEKGDAG